MVYLPPDELARLEEEELRQKRLAASAADVETFEATSSAAADLRLGPARPPVPGLTPLDISEGATLSPSPFAGATATAAATAQAAPAPPPALAPTPSPRDLEPGSPEELSFYAGLSPEERRRRLLARAATEEPLSATPPSRDVLGDIRRALIGEPEGQLLQDIRSPEALGRRALGALKQGALQMVSGEENLKQIGVPIERAPAPVRYVAEELLSPVNVLTAGAGPALAPALRGVPVVGRAAAALAEPVIARGPFAARLAGEAAIGIAARTAAEETAQRLPEETPGAVRLPAALGAGLAAGGAAAGALGAAVRAAPEAGARALRTLPAEAAQAVGPPPPGAAAPPPPTPPATPPPTARPPEVERVLTQAAEIVRQDRPGAVGRAVLSVPGARPLREVYDTAIRISDEVMQGLVGRQSIHAEIQQGQFAHTNALASRMDTLFGRGTATGGKTNVAYVGPADNAIRGTFKDIAENPEWYQLSPEQARFITDEYGAWAEGLRQSGNVGFGADTGRFKVKPGAAYVPSVDISAEALERLRTPTQAASAGRAKTRFYETAYERMQHDAQFVPETNMRILMQGLANNHAYNAGQQVLKFGAGGKTRLELMADQHPKLYQTMMGLRQRLQSLRGSAARLDERTAEAIDDFLASGAEPEEIAQFLADLPTQARIQPPPHPGMRVSSQVGMSAAQIRKEINSVRSQIQNLQKAWQTANIRNYKRVDQAGFLYYPTADADELVRALGDRASPVAHLLSEWNATVLGGDLSPLTGVQAPLAFLFTPLATTRQIAAGLVRSVKQGDLLAPFRADTMAQDIAREIQSWRDFAFYTGRAITLGTPEEFKGGLLQRIPGYTTLNQGAYAGVTRLMKRMFDDAVKTLEAQGIDPIAARAAAGDIVTKAIPQLNPSRAGLSASQALWQRAPFTSVAFIRQPAALMADAATAYVKLGLRQTLTPREKLAATLVTKLIGTVTALSVASVIADAQMRNDDIETRVKNAINPTSPDFWSIYAPGTGFRIPIGGPYRALVRAVVPREVDTPGGKAWIPFAGLPQYLANRATPAIKTQVDLIRNQDFFRHRIVTGDFPMNIIQALQYEVEGILPITAGEVAGGLRRGESARELAAEGVSGFMGASAIPESAFAVKNRIAQQRYGAGYTDLEPSQQKVIDNLPEVKKAEARSPFADPGQAALKQIDADRLAGEQQAVARYQQTGDSRAFREQVSAIQTEAAIRRAQADSDFGIFKQSGKLPSDPGKAALVQYYAVFDKARLAGGILDWETLDAEMASLEAGWTAEQKAYVERNTGPAMAEHVPEVAQLLADKKKIADSGYWTISDRVLQRWLEDNDATGYPTTWDAFTAYVRQRVAEALQQQGITSNAEIERFTTKVLNQTGLPDTITQVKAQFLASNREVRDLVDRLGYSFPLQTTKERERELAGGGVR